MQILLLLIKIPFISFYMSFEQRKNWMYKAKVTRWTNLIRWTNRLFKRFNRRFDRLEVRRRRPLTFRLLGRAHVLFAGEQEEAVNRVHWYQPGHRGERSAIAGSACTCTWIAFNKILSTLSSHSVPQKYR